MFRFNLWPRPLMPTSSLPPPGVESPHFLPPPPGALAPFQPSFPVGNNLDSLKPTNSEKDAEKLSPVSLPHFGMPLSVLRASDVTQMSHFHASLLSPLHQHFLRAQLELASSARAQRKDELTKHLPPGTSSSAFTPTKRLSPDELMTSRSLDTSLRHSDASSPGEVGANRGITSSACGETNARDVSSPISHVSAMSSHRGDADDVKTPGRSKMHDVT